MENHLKLLLTTSIVLLIVLDTMLGGVTKTKGRQSQQVMYNVEHSGEKSLQCEWKILDISSFIEAQNN